MNAAVAPLGTVLLESDGSGFCVTLRRPGEWPQRNWFTDAERALAAANETAALHDLPLIKLGETETHD